MKGNELIDRIVTGNESLIHFWTPETKAQSKVWKRKEEDTPKKSKTVPSVGKVILTIFWDYCGPVYREFGDDGKIRVTQHMYFDTILHLRAAIKNKRPGLLVKPRNAWPHTAQLVANVLESFHWEVLQTLPTLARPNA